MNSRVLRAACCIILITITRCTSLAPLRATPTPFDPTQGEPDSISSTTSTPPLTLTLPAPPSITIKTLRVWLPVQFDPAGDSESARLLTNRLGEFSLAHPGLAVEIRLKADEGESGLLNSLILAASAAPSALPDLILLPRPDLESAALMGLHHPIDGLSFALDDSNLYPYARELSRVQGVAYGLPFAGDALVLFHRPELEINTWDDILLREESLVFFANDPQGLVGLSLYISSGGKILDEQGLPTLEEAPLLRVLALIQNGMTANVIPPFTLNFESDSQVFDAYREGRANMAFVWVGNTHGIEDGVIQSIPGVNVPHTFASGWVWALAGSDLANQQSAIELAEYLLAEDFAREWTRASGYLPTRVSPDANAILESAQVIPSNDALAVLGPLMQEALTRVLNGDQPEVVVGSVIEKLK